MMHQNCRKHGQWIANGSFEEGETLEDVLLWHRMAGTSPAVNATVGWEIDESDAVHGSRSLKTLTGAPLLLMEEVWEPIPLEEPWIFSVYLKADREDVSCELSVTLWWKFERETVSSSVKLTREWKRYEVIVQGIPRLVRRSSSVQGPVNFEIRPCELATVWADAAQWTRLADSDQAVKDGPRVFFENAQQWTLPRPALKPLVSSHGDWTGTVPLRVWRDGSGPATRLPVAVGVPFSRGVWNGGGRVSLRRADGGKVDVQIEVLSHWDQGQSVQVIGVFFTDQMGAGWSDYTLCVEPGKESEQEGDGTFVWSLNAGEIVGQLWEGIERDGCRILDSASLRAVGLDGTLYDSAWDNEATSETERDGALYRVIRCSGRLMDRKGRSLLAYVARLHLWRDLPGVKLEISVVNPRKEGSVRLRSLHWSTRDVSPDTLTGNDVPAASLLIADLPSLPEERKPLYLEAGGLLLHVLEGWQRHPSALACEGGELRGYLWPGAGVRALALPRGLALTREFWLREVTAVDDVPEAWDADPIGIAAPSWWAKRSILLPLTEAEPERFPLMEGWLAGPSALDKLAPAQVEADCAYGVFDFGDNHGDGGWANLESFHDWCALLVGLRSGDPVALRAGLGGARHYRDIDINQLSGACYEHTFNHVAGQADMSHAWPDGVNLHYLLTGSRRSLEVALLHGEYTLALPPDELTHGLRTLGRYLFNLVEGYQLTGDPRFRQRFEVQLAAARQLLAGDAENPDRSIFSYIGRWQVRRLVPFHAWYGIAALQKMEALTGCPALAELISSEIAASLNPELYDLDLQELWPGVAPAQGMPLMLADFARHRGSFFYPVMLTEAESRGRPELAQLALATLYAGAVEGRSEGQLQTVLSLAALKGVTTDEDQLVASARSLLWEAAAETLLNGDFSLSETAWHYWRPCATKSLAHHTNWQSVRKEAAVLDPHIVREGLRSLRLNLAFGGSLAEIKLDTARFRMVPGQQTLLGWLKWDGGAVCPEVSLELRDLDGHFERLPLLSILPVDTTAPRLSSRSVQVGEATLGPPDLNGWREMRVVLDITKRTVANLFIRAGLKERMDEGHVWIDSFRLEPGRRSELPLSYESVREPARQTPPTETLT